MYDGKLIAQALEIYPIHKERQLGVYVKTILSIRTKYAYPIENNT